MKRSVNYVSTNELENDIVTALMSRYGFSSVSSLFKFLLHKEWRLSHEWLEVMNPDGSKQRVLFIDGQSYTDLRDYINGGTDNGQT